MSVKSKDKAVKQDDLSKGPVLKTKTIQVTQKVLYSPDGKSCVMVESRPDEPYLTVDQNPNRETKLKSEGWVELNDFITLPKWMHAPDGKSGQRVETPAQYLQLQRHGWVDAPEGFHGTPEDVKKAKAADQKAVADKAKAQTAADKDHQVADRKKAAEYAKMSPEDQSRQKEVDRNTFTQDSPAASAERHAGALDSKEQKKADKALKSENRKAEKEQKKADKKSANEDKAAKKRAALLK